MSKNLFLVANVDNFHLQDFVVDYQMNNFKGPPISKMDSQRYPFHI